MEAISHSHEHYHPPLTPKKPNLDILSPLRNWVDNLEIKNSRLAHLLCTIIPCCCPFERDVTVFGHTFFHIPPLCKLNPLYDEFVYLRFRSLSYLTDVCGEDVTKYIC